MLTFSQCDEVRPVCGNCIKRFPNAEEECGYEATLCSPVSTIHRSLSAASTSTSSSGTTRSMELRLFHHYSTVTCHDMPLCEEEAGRTMWAITVPAIAFDSPFVYSAVLAISALHLLTFNPDEHSLRTTSFQYMDETLCRHQKEMTNINSDNGLALFTSGVLLTMHAKLRLRYMGSSSAIYTLPLNYLHLQMGARKLYHETRKYVQDTNVDEWIALRPSNRASFQSSLPIELPPDRLLSEWSSDPTISLERRKIYAYVFDLLGLIRGQFDQGEDLHWIRHQLGKWPSRLPKEFIGYIEEYDPLAMVILARMYALTKLVDEPWWVRGTAEYEVRGLTRFVPAEWAWAMDWPLKVLDLSAGSMSSADEY